MKIQKLFSTLNLAQSGTRAEDSLSSLSVSQLINNIYQQKMSLYYYCLDQWPSQRYFQESISETFSALSARRLNEEIKVMRCGEYPVSADRQLYPLQITLLHYSLPGLTQLVSPVLLHLLDRSAGCGRDTNHTGCPVQKLPIQLIYPSKEQPFLPDSIYFCFISIKNISSRGNLISRDMICSTGWVRNNVLWQ